MVECEEWVVTIEGSLLMESERERGCKEFVGWGRGIYMCGAA